MISMNKKYKTRDGRPVRLLCTNRSSKLTRYTVVALVDKGETLEVYTEDGCATIGCETPQDLIEISEWDDFQVDEPAMVRDKNDSEWERRYFAGVTKEGRPSTWRSGVTSWTNMDGCSISCWDECRRPTEEELKR